MNKTSRIGIRFLPCFLAILCGTLAEAQIQMLPQKEVYYLFPGKNRSIEVTLRNNGNDPVDENLSTRIYQSSSSISVPIGKATRWKSLLLAGHQTVIESFIFDLPAVRTDTEFRIRFAAEDERHLGEIEIRVLPSNLLEQLSSLADEIPIGVLDPENQLKPLFKQNKVAFDDLEEDAGFDKFRGKLAIIGPFQSKDSVPENLGKRIVAKREQAIAIVWIQPPDKKVDPFLPVYLMRKNDNVIVVVRNDVVANLADSPRSQLDLLRAARLALNPDLLQLPDADNP